MEWIPYLGDNRWGQVAVLVIGSLLGSWIFEVLIIGLLRKLAERTKSRLDDLALELLKRPLFISLLLIGLHWAVEEAELGSHVEWYVTAVFSTIAIVMWTTAGIRLSSVLLRAWAREPKPGRVVQARTLPLFDIVTKTCVFALAIYAVMTAWDINVGAWFASAGVLGAAAGFAAQDSLGNYFAGVFIIADAPYKINDIITLTDGTRGRVTDIGLRSTRLQTLDDVEINVPNSVLGSMTILNHTAGPAIPERIAMQVGVAYGSSVEQVMRVLTASVCDIEHVSKERKPVVRFVGLGDSSLDFKVMVWCHPSHFEQVQHDMHVAVYDGLNAATIEIPFPQQDIYLKEIPTVDPG